MYAIACTLPHMRTHLLAQLPIKVHGEISPYDDYHFDIVTLSGGYSGTSFAVENKSADMELELTMDCEGSTNTRSRTGSLKSVVTVPPGQFELLHHLSPDEGHGPWGWTYALSFMTKALT